MNSKYVIQSMPSFLVSYKQHMPVLTSFICKCSWRNLYELTGNDLWSRTDGLTDKVLLKFQSPL